MKSNFELFLCTDFDAEHGIDHVRRESLLKKAVIDYGIPEAVVNDFAILRTDKGKPYFEGVKVYFNISHSGNLWACLVGGSCCGLDVQYIRPCNFEKIAGRFFSPLEQSYVQEKGIIGFYDIWTRREAYGKYTGDGFFGVCPEFVDERGRLVEEAADKNGDIVVIKELFVEEDVKSAVCFLKHFDSEVIIRENWCK